MIIQFGGNSEDFQTHRDRQLPTKLIFDSSYSVIQKGVRTIKLNEYEIHFIGGKKINFITKDDLKRAIENETLLSMWDCHKEKFVIFRNIIFVRYLGEIDLSKNS